MVEKGPGFWVIFVCRVGRDTKESHHLRNQTSTKNSAVDMEALRTEMYRCG